jgi:hypothetical protein
MNGVNQLTGARTTRPPQPTHQPLQVLVDTGSVNLIVPSIACRGCFPSNVRGANNLAAAGAWVDGANCVCGGGGCRPVPSIIHR